MARKLCKPSECVPFETLHNKLLSASDTSVVVLGDSWTDSNVIPDTIKSALLAVHGTEGGSGWNDIKAFNRTGNWTVIDQITSALGVDMQHLVTTDPNAEFSVAGFGTSTRLHYYCMPGGGDFEYRFNGQPWIPVSQDGPQQHKTITVTGGNVTGNSLFRMRVINVGTGLKFTGVDYQIPGGIRVHEMGNGGLHSGHLANMLAFPALKAKWQAALAAMNPCALVVQLGTNDHGVPILPATYAQNMLQIQQCAQQAIPGLDVILWSPADNNRDNPESIYGVDEYAAALNAANPDECNTKIVDGYATLGPLDFNSPYWSEDNALHLTDEGDVAYTQPVISCLTL